MANPLLGVVFHWIGGFASASFYVPYTSVRRWSWEVFWLTGGVVSWIIAPWFFASIQTHDLIAVLRATPMHTLFLCWMFGVLWGFGGLTFGLTMRFLGISLGTAVALGLTAAFGTLIPPLVSGQLVHTLIRSVGGLTVLFGVLVALGGIFVVGVAGNDKEHEQAALAVVGEPKVRNFKRGMAVAIFSGIMSSCFAYGLAEGEPIRQLTLAHGTNFLWQGLPVLCIVLLGGFTTNAICCLFMIVKNHSAGELLGRKSALDRDPTPIPVRRNLILCAIAGASWYFQFFFYTMGESQMGRFGFSSWSIHMSSIIIFAALWGLSLHEWRGASRRSFQLLAIGITILVISTGIIGYGNLLASHA
jgi:L-rhamnose-H+ transport protein